MTTFLRVLEETENKEAALIDTIRGQTGLGRSRYEADPAQFGSIEKSPFAYWISKEIRELFSNLPKLEGEGRTAKQGLATADDFRFVRLWWEVPENQFRKRWFPFAKGGKYSPYYDDIYLVVNWENDGLEIRNNCKEGSSRIASRPQNTDFYYRPGLTWPRRTKSGLSMRPLNTGSIFADKGSSLFIQSDLPEDLCMCMGLTMSKVFVYLIKVFLAAGDAKKGGAAHSYEVGVLQAIPFRNPSPELRSKIAEFSKKLWANRYRLSQGKENSHSFLRPILLQVSGNALVDRFEAHANYLKLLAGEFAAIQGQIDSVCFDLYGVNDADRQAIDEAFQKPATGKTTTDSEEPRFDDEEDQEGEEDLSASSSSPEKLAQGFMSWAVGVVFGRFDARCVGQSKASSCLPAPFDPIPSSSPGMLSREPSVLADLLSNYPVPIPENGILVDDIGNPALDLVGHIRQVVHFAFAPHGDTWWQELCQILDPQSNDLRQWLRKDFFQLHLSQYSASRRKAPLYWPIATSSRGYAVWLYSHRATPDTLYRVVELVRLRNKDAELELARLDEPSGADERRARNDLEMLVAELKELLVELERIQPLFHPNLDDGTVLVLAPLHRLFKAYPVWQQELADRWKDLVRGEYDWSSQAMRLWPDRVVRKCQTDRSLAIAHGLDEFFWQSGPSEKAVARPVSEGDIQREIAQRTEPAIQYALRSLLDAPPQTRGGARRPAPARAPRGSADRSSTPKTASAEKRRSSSADPQDLNRQVLAFLQGQSGLVAKKEILEGTGVFANQWSRVIDALIEQGLVEKVGEKRGAGYRVKDNSDAGGPS